MATRKTAAPRGDVELDEGAEAIAAGMAEQMDEMASQLTPEDAYNLIALLNRVQVTGTREATTLAILSQKLTALVGDFVPGEAPRA